MVVVVVVVVITAVLVYSVEYQCGGHAQFVWCCQYGGDNEASDLGLSKCGASADHKQHTH